MPCQPSAILVVSAPDIAPRILSQLVQLAPVFPPMLAVDVPIDRSTFQLEHALPLLLKFFELFHGSHPSLVELGTMAMLFFFLHRGVI